jgi:hypothetical protein
MNGNTLLDAQLDKRYTEYQRTMSKLYNLHPATIPEQEPELVLPDNGFRRGLVTPILPPPITPAEEAQRLAGVYGVSAKYVLPAVEAEQAAAEREQLDAQRLAKREELAKKFGVKAEHVPLEWLDL